MVFNWQSLMLRHRCEGRYRLGYYRMLAPAPLHSTCLRRGLPIHLNVLVFGRNVPSFNELRLRLLISGSLVRAQQAEPFLCGSSSKDALTL